MQESQGATGAGVGVGAIVGAEDLSITGLVSDSDSDSDFDSVLDLDLDSDSEESDLAASRLAFSSAILASLLASLA